MSGVLIFSAVALLVDKLYAVLVAFALVVNSAFDAIKTFFTLLFAGYTYALANRRLQLVLFTAAALCIFGICGVFFTNIALNAADAVNACIIRPGAEFVLKFGVHTLRFLWETFSSFWNTIVLYLYDACLTCFFYDGRDWVNNIVDRIATLVTSNSYANLSPLAVIPQIFTNVGNIVTVFWDVPFIFYTLVECGTHFWTKPRVNWAVPTFTTQEPTAFHPAFFRIDHLVASPTNSPVTPAPTPMPSPTPPPGSQYEFWSSHAYEFNPRYGAFTGFFGGFQSSTTTLGRIANHIRRVLVAVHTFVANAIRTILLIIKSQRTALSIDLWGSLIVKTDSELSLWRQFADTSASFVSIFIAAFTPVQIPSNECPGLPKHDEFSNYRFAAEHAVYRIFRRMLMIPRAFSLILYDLTTTRIGSVPVFDFLFTVLSGQNPLAVNLITREALFCDTYYGANFLAIDTFGLIMNCPFMIGHTVGDCKKIWDGTSYTQFFDASQNFKVRHTNELFDAVTSIFYIPTDLVAAYNITQCGTYVPPPVLASYLKLMPRILQLVRIFVADVPMRFLYMRLAINCSPLQIVPIAGAYFKWFFIDYMMNRVIPIIISTFTGYDCVHGQNLFTCIITQLAITDDNSPQLFRGFCQFIRTVTDLINEAVHIINQIIFYLSKAVYIIVNGLQFILQGLLDGIMAVINGLASFVTNVGDCLSSIGDSIANFFGFRKRLDCSWEPETVATPPTLNLAPPNFSVSIPDISYIMPCDPAQYAYDISVHGPLNDTIDKRGIREGPLWLRDDDTVDVNEFMRIYYGGASGRKRSAFDSVDDETRDEEVKKAWEDVKPEIISSLRKLIIATDARKFYQNVETCFIGTPAIPSQYSLCREIELALLSDNATSADSACISSRCARVALKCLRSGNKKNARRMMNPDALNIFQDSYISKAAFFFVDTSVWVAEATTCSVASPELARTAAHDNSDGALRMVFATLGFAWDFVRRTRYAATNYAYAYYDCLDSTEQWARAVAHPRNADVVERYVRCLEAPYVDPAAQWNVPDALREDDDLQSIFATYLDSQGVNGRVHGACAQTLRRQGLLFDRDAEKSSGSSEQLTYRLCSMLHALGTRATLATRLATMHGSEKVVGGHVRLNETRSGDWWAPLPDRSVGNYLNLWRAPMSILRSTEFMTTTLLFDTLEYYTQQVGRFLVSMCEFFAHAVPTAIRVFRRFLTEGYPQAAIVVRYVTYLADLYDELIDPIDLADRLRGRSDRVFVHPIDREAVALRWQAAMQADVKLLREMTEQAGKKDRRGLDIHTYLTYDQFRNTGLRVSRARLDSLRAANDSRKRYKETYDGVDADGWESYTILIHNEKFAEIPQPYQTAPLVYERNDDEGFGDVVRNFADAQYMRLSMKLDSEGNYKTVTSQRAKKVARSGPRPSGGSTTPVSLEILPSRNQYNASEVRIDVRIVKDAQTEALEQNLSAAWTFSAFQRIDLNVLSESLQNFIDGAAVNESLSHDVNEAMQARDILAELSGSTVENDGLPALYKQDPEQFAIALQEGRAEMPTAWEIHEARQARFTPVSKALLGSAMTSVMNIIDRRTRLADLPQTQAMGMYVSALASGRADLIGDWLSGRLGYVNGVGFVPRSYYEQYMQDLQSDRENYLTPFASFLGANGKRPTGSTSVSRVMTPFFARPYDTQLREADKRATKQAARHARFVARFENAHVRRQQELRSATLIKSGHFETDIMTGDGHTFDKHRALAPHIYEMWVQNGLDVNELRRIMDETTESTRTDGERVLLRRSLVLVSSDTIMPSLEEIGDFFDRIIEYLFGKGSVLRNAWLTLKVGVENLFDLIVDGIDTVPGAFWDWIVGVSCVVPDDYVKDGTGTYKWSCLFSRFLPERLFAIFSVWPSNANNGDIQWPDEAYVGGVPVYCDGTALDIVSNRFRPDAYCTLGVNYTPLYDDWKQADMCIATRDNDGKARMCLSAGLSTSGSSVFPLCPACEYCVKEYSSCVDAGYGVDPIRVLQVYTHQLGVVWDEILDVTNNLFAVLVYFLLFNGTVDGGPFGLVTGIPLILMTLYGAIFASQSWLYTALFASFLSVVFLPVFGIVFYAYMLFRYLWYHNTALFNSIFLSSLSSDPFAIPYPDVMIGIGKLIRLIGEIPIPWFSLTNQPLSYFAPWLNTLADEFSLFANGGSPTQFEQMCSAFGIWTVIALFAALVVVAFAIFVFGSLAVSLVALALALALLVLTFFGYGAVLFVSLLFTLVALDRFGGSTRVDSRVGEVEREMAREKAETRAIEKYTLEREANIEQEMEQLRRAAKVPATTTPASSRFVDAIMAEEDEGAVVTTNASLRRRLGGGVFDQEEI